MTEVGSEKMKGYPEGADVRKYGSKQGQTGSREEASERHLKSE